MISSSSTHPRPARRFLGTRPSVRGPPRCCSSIRLRVTLDRHGQPGSAMRPDAGSAWEMTLHRDDRGDAGRLPSASSIGCARKTQLRSTDDAPASVHRPRSDDGGRRALPDVYARAREAWAPPASLHAGAARVLRPAESRSQTRSRGRSRHVSRSKSQPLPSTPCMRSASRFRRHGSGVAACRARGGKVWAVGTTCSRARERVRTSAAGDERTRRPAS